jgi:mono/diheme cytochrome c family protein
MSGRAIGIGALVFALLVVYRTSGFQGVPPGQLPPQERPKPQTPADQKGHSVQSVQGSVLYGAYCASCHGLDGRGNGPVAAVLKVPPPDLTRITQRHGGKFPRELVEKTILGENAATIAHGSREMPVWGPIFGQIEWDQDLRAVRVRNLSDYLASIQERSFRQ